MNDFGGSNHHRLMLMASVVIIVSSVAWPAAAQRQKFCGPSLVKALNLVCLTFPTYHKRSTGYAEQLSLNENVMNSDWPLIDEDDVGRLNAIEQLRRMMMFLPKHRAPIDDNVDNHTEMSNSIPGHYRIAKRGVVDECCIQPCSIEQLQTYCGLLNNRK